MRKTGIYRKLGDLDFFIPNALPPANPPLQMSTEIMSLFGEASFALGQLNEMSERLPDPKRFIRAYVIKEALLTSAIEGIHTTLLNILTQSITDAKPNKDTQLVLNYTNALEASIYMIKQEGLPLSSRIILKAHEKLMSTGEGEKANPGNFRKQSVKVGDLIPPPATEIANLISDLEKYINTPSDTPQLIKAGLAHVQFETIHPFLDGNGRIGRLLIVLMLIDGGLLNLPIIYPSYFFKKHQLEYYHRLDGVRTRGDFEGWIIYYLRAVRDSARHAYLQAKEIETLERKLKEFIQTDPSFKKARETAIQSLEYLFNQPVTDITHMSKALGKSYNTIQKNLQLFENHHLLTESSTFKRNKLYRFDPYLKLLE